MGNEKTYCIENPEYTKIRKVYEINSVNYVCASIDDKGMNIKELIESNAQIAHISPNHHFPTGITMPASRRYEILGWANEKNDRYIIEDDYEYVSSTSMLIWTFYANNTATERITLEMNGITMVDKTLHFSYEYKGSTIKLTSESGNISEYEISVSGNTMRLGNQKDGYFNLKKM